ncbi:MAG: hypothetical protein WC821_05210 [archaeon]|jgi:hypothetical protein
MVSKKKTVKKGIKAKSKKAVKKNIKSKTNLKKVIKKTSRKVVKKHKRIIVLKSAKSTQIHPASPNTFVLTSSQFYLDRAKVQREKELEEELKKKQKEKGMLELVIGMIKRKQN